MAQPAKTTETAPVPFVSAFNLFAPSIEVLKRNVLSYVLFLFVPLALMTIGNFGMDESVATATDPFAPFRSGYGALLGTGYLLLLFTMPALLVVLTRGAQAQPTAPDEALALALRQFFRLIGLLIVLSLIFTVSLLLLVVPLFFTLPRYILAPYYMIDQKLTIRQALKASATDSKKYRGAIWGVIGVNVLLMFAGVIPLLGAIASLVLGVMYQAAYAVRYAQIQQVNMGKAPVAPIEKELAEKNQA